MPAACRADVEALLRARKLDRTLVPTWEQAPAVVGDTVSTGVAEVDRRLGGGLPRGQLSELTGARSSGRTSLLLTVLATSTARGELVALVDTFDMFDPRSAAAAGVDLERLLWIRGDACTPAFPALASRQAGPDRVIERALKALNLVLQAGGFGVVALDLADAPVPSLRHVPQSTWIRLQRVLEGQDTVGLLVGSMPLSRSAGGVSLALEPKRQHQDSSLVRPQPSARCPERAALGASPSPRQAEPAALPSLNPVGRWSGNLSGTRLFCGLESEVQILRARVITGLDGCLMQVAAHA
jgi:recombination protein RecA